MQTLIGATRSTYNALHGTQAARIVNSTSPAAIQALLTPLAATETNIQPLTTFGAGVLLNTVGTVTPILAQFFFLLALNGACATHSLYTTLSPKSSFLYRRTATLLYTFGAALAQTGYTWAFRESWAVNGYQFVLTWMAYWLLMYAHLLFLDTVMTIAPMPMMPFVVLAWIFTNIASTLSPLELQAGFFKGSYALPGMNGYEVLMTVWTGGARNRLYRNLPVLFGWVIVGTVTVAWAHWRACGKAEGLKELEKDEDEEKKMGMEDSGVGIAISAATTVGREEVEEEELRQRDIYGAPLPAIGGAI
jgi:hypothetical protein